MEQERVVITQEMVGDVCKNGGDFSNKIIVFAEGASFGGKTIEKDLEFEGATFEGYIDFENATFECNSPCFSEANFENGVTFKNATFVNWAIFEGTIFVAVTFENATFMNYAVFKRATFKDADFEDAAFDGGADFKGATFGENACLSLCVKRGEILIDDPFVAQAISFASQGIIISPKDIRDGLVEALREPVEQE